MYNSLDELTLILKKAGSLRNQINNLKISKLILSGPLNGTDFKAIRDQKELTHLDLTNCQFVGGGRAYIIIDNRIKIKCISTANELSDYMLVRMKNSKGYEAVFLPQGLLRIGKSALAGHTSLKSIIIPDSVEEIDDSAFNCCCELIEIRFGTNLKRIGDYAFWRMNSLTYLLIPSNVKEIGISSLSSTKLEVVKILNPHPPQIKKEIFEPMILAFFKKLKTKKHELVKLSPFFITSCKVIVPKNCITRYKRAPGWKYFPNIVSE